MPSAPSKKHPGNSAYCAGIENRRLIPSLLSLSFRSLGQRLFDDMLRGLNIPGAGVVNGTTLRSEEHTSELQSLRHLVCRLLLEKKIPGIALFGFAVKQSEKSAAEYAR